MEEEGIREWEAAVAAASDRDLFDNYFLEEGAVMLSLDEVPYDRDMKWVNVPIRGGRTGAAVAPPRMLKAINKITGGNKDELKRLDEHYRRLDKRKDEFESNRRRPIGPKTSTGAKRKSNKSNRDQINPGHSKTSTPRVLIKRDDGLEYESAAVASNCHPELNLRPDAREFVPAGFTKTSIRIFEAAFASDCHPELNLRPDAREFVPAGMTKTSVGMSEAVVVSNGHPELNLRPDAKEFVPAGMTKTSIGMSDASSSKR